MGKRYLFIAALLAGWSMIASAQTIVAPNFGLKSHETLEIKKIEISGEATSFYMSIENRIKGGSFCADKNIYLVYSDGFQVKLLSAEGIPVCPSQYKFRLVGEKIDFVLRFPALRPGTEWVSLVEMCGDNCFSFYGITLNENLNKRIDGIFERIGKEAASSVLPDLIILLEGIDTQNAGIEGLLYLTVIKLFKESGDNAKASEWYKKFLKSGSPELSRYILNLEAQGIRY